MAHYIKLHYLSDSDYESRDVLSDSYNESLKLMWKEKVVFFNEWKDDFYKDGVDYEENEIYSKIFDIKWYQEIWSGENSYYVVQINFIDIIENEIDEFQERFLADLRTKVQFVYKFEDSRFLEIRKCFFEDIYKVETSLREVMSFIFFTTYYDIGGFLRDLRVTDTTEKIWLSQDDLRNNLENEFFYISFKDYRNLLELKPMIKEVEITKLIIDSQSFNEWKRRITERGVREEPYVAFINSIKRDLESLEVFRNAIMHNHHFNLKLKQEYEKSKNSILAKTEEFLIRHVHILWNYFSLIPWKEYLCTWDMENFRKWKKYILSRIEFGDYFFIWDDWKEQWFRDKEFIELFSY